MAENLIHRKPDYARLFWRSCHCVGLSCSGLTVPEYADIEAIKSPLDDRLVALLVKMSVVDIGSEDAVEIVRFMDVFPGDVLIIKGDLLQPVGVRVRVRVRTCCIRERVQESSGEFRRVQESSGER
jgi:hypothetical protein